MTKADPAKELILLQEAIAHSCHIVARAVLLEQKARLKAAFVVSSPILRHMAEEARVIRHAWIGH